MGMTRSGRALLEEAGEAGADAGGVDDDPGGAPVAGEGEDVAVEGGVFGAEPEAAVDGAVGGQGVGPPRCAWARAPGGR